MYGTFRNWHGETAFRERVFLDKVSAATDNKTDSIVEAYPRCLVVGRYDMCKVSVVMSAYNAEKYIAEAIDSILGQTFGDFEFIILDNCSEDRTTEIICSYHDERIRFVQNETNLGIAGSLNKGIELSQGQYIARMDADDVCYPDRFSIQVKYMDAHPEVCLCAGQYDFVVQGKMQRTPQSKTISPDVMRFCQYFGNKVAHSTAMIRASVLRDNRLEYDSRYRIAQDYKLWMDLLRVGNQVVLNEKFIQYRIHEGNLSGNQVVTQQEATEIAEDALAQSSLPQEDCLLLSRAYRKEIQTYDEIERLGLALLRLYRECNLRMEDVEARDLLEHIFYGFLSDYTYQGWPIYWHVVKTGIFRWDSILGLKLLVKSLIKWRRSA